jgi:hypothetical protein
MLLLFRRANPLSCSEGPLCLHELARKHMCHAKRKFQRRGGKGYILISRCFMAMLVSARHPIFLSARANHRVHINDESTLLRSQSEITLIGTSQLFSTSSAPSSYGGDMHKKKQKANCQKSRALLARPAIRQTMLAYPPRKCYEIECEMSYVSPHTRVRSPTAP